MIDQIICGDCLELMKEIPDKSVDLVLTDPPYGIGYHSNHYVGKNPFSPVAGDWNFQIGNFLIECKRVLKDGGAIYTFCRWDVMPKWLPAFEASGLKVKTVLVWLKDNWSAGDLTGSFGNQYEQIIFASSGRHILKSKRWPNVWQFPRVPAKEMLHPTQKPVELLKRAIQASTEEGQLVLDPFGGAGSVAKACAELNRHYILMDIDKNMVNISRKRLGLPVDYVAPRKEIHLSSIEPPSAEDWGVHPEDLILIRDELKGNVRTFLTGGLQ